MKIEELPSAPVTFIIHRLTLLNCNIEVNCLIGLKRNIISSLLCYYGTVILLQWRLHLERQKWLQPAEECQWWWPGSGDSQSHIDKQSCCSQTSQWWSQLSQHQQISEIQSKSGQCHRTWESIPLPQTENCIHILIHLPSDLRSVMKHWNSWKINPDAQIKSL